MTTSEPAGVVAELWRFPVKSMGGGSLEEAILTGQGVLGDRGFALLDVETDEVVSASNTRHFPGLLDCRAAFLEPPQAGWALPPVRITLPDGSSGTSDSPSLPALLSAHLGRRVTLVSTVPDAYATKQSTFFARLDLACTAPTESFVDLCPVSVITTATLAELSLAYQGSTFDPRRFRMNVVVATKPGGFVENAWAGRRLALGWQVRLAVTMPDPRCVITTLAQGDLDKDPDILRTVAQRNSLPVGRGGPLPCAGVYAAVE
ncbi:MAG: MOSC N-terminal beta barrel domain-containing protein, partial [Gemmatimonadales bacterium]